MAIAASNQIMADATRMDNENNNLTPDNAESFHSPFAEKLRESLLLLSEFASLDSSGYQASFSSRSRLDSAATTSTVDSEACNSIEEADESHGSKNHLKRLEELQSEKQMQDTPIPTLWRAIHRLHSNLAILQENEGRHALEVRLLRDELKRTKRENGKLRKSTKVLTEQNVVLKQKLQEKRTLIKKAKNFFRDSTEQRKGLEEENAKIKIEAHELFLQQSNRQRMNSSDSNFSDADALFFAGQESSSSMLPEGATVADGDAVSLQSSNSGSSFITDGGCAAVRLQQQDRTASWQTGEESNFSDDLALSNTSCDVPGGPLKHPASPRNPGEYKLLFPCGRPLSINVKVIPLSELPLPPKGMLTSDLLQEDVSMETKKNDSWSPRIPNLLKGSEAKDFKGNAFIVSGFDDDLEIKPTLGARVVAINGTAVKPEWKLRDFMAHVFDVVGPIDESIERSQATDGGAPLEDLKPCEIVTDDDASVVSSIGEKKNSDRSFSISFRNDALSKRQRDMLNRKDATPDAASETDAKIEQRSFGLGFLKNLGRQGNLPEGKEDGVDTADKKLEAFGREENESNADQTSSTKGKGRNKLFFWNSSEDAKASSRDELKSDESGLASEDKSEEINEAGQPKESLSHDSEMNAVLMDQPTSQTKDSKGQAENPNDCNDGDELSEASTPRTSHTEEPRSSAKARFMGPFWRTSPKIDKSDSTQHATDEDDDECL